MLVEGGRKIGIRFNSLVKILRLPCCTYEFWKSSVKEAGAFIPQFLPAPCLTFLLGREARAGHEKSVHISTNAIFARGKLAFKRGIKPPNIYVKVNKICIRLPKNWRETPKFQGGKKLARSGSQGSSHFSYLARAVLLLQNIPLYLAIIFSFSRNMSHYLRAQEVLEGEEETSGRRSQDY